VKDQLVPLLTARAGLDQEKAEEAIDAVLNYLRDNPQLISSYLETSRLGGLASASKAGGLFS
jgi:hypothetical protein